MRTLPPAVKRDCPVCGRSVAIRNIDGKIREHRFEGVPCEGGSPSLNKRRGYR